MKEVQDISYINTNFSFSPYRFGFFKFFDLKFKINRVYRFAKTMNLMSAAALSSIQWSRKAQCLSCSFLGFNLNPSLYKENRARQIAEVLVLHVLEKQEISCRHSCLMSRCDVTLGINKKVLAGLLLRAKFNSGRTRKTQFLRCFSLTTLKIRGVTFCIAIFCLKS